MDDNISCFRFLTTFYEYCDFAGWIGRVISITLLGLSLSYSTRRHRQHYLELVPKETAYSFVPKETAYFSSETPRRLPRLHFTLPSHPPETHLTPNHLPHHTPWPLPTSLPPQENVRWRRIKKLFYRNNFLFVDVFLNGQKIGGTRPSRPFERKNVKVHHCFGVFSKNRGEGHFQKMIINDEVYYSENLRNKV